MPPSPRRSFPNRSAILIALLLALLLGACAAPTAQSVTDVPVALPTAPQPVAPESTATPEPVISKVILVNGSAPGPQAQALQAALQELADQNGDQLETRPALNSGDVQPGWRVVVLAAPQDDLAQIASAAPATQFVLISPVDVQVPANVSVIRIHKEYEAFAAGFIAVIITNDLRAAGLFPSDTALGATIDDAFRNGGAYFCGRCIPQFTPYVRFPVPVSLPGASPLADWQNVATTLGQTIVYTVYVDPQVSSPELLYDLGSRGYYLIGGQTPIDQVRPRWILTLQSDLVTPLQDLWPALLAGSGGQVVSAGLSFSDVNADIFTPGKQRLAKEMIATLTKGFINPFNP